MVVQIKRHVLQALRDPLVLVQRGDLEEEVVVHQLLRNVVYIGLTM